MKRAERFSNDANARRALVAGAVISLAVAAGSAQAAQVVATWNGGTGSWNTASSWSGGVVPNNGTTTYDVRIDGGKAIGSVVTLAGSTTVDLLTVDSGDRVNTSVRSFVLASGGAATINGLFSLDLGGQFLWNGPASLYGTGQFLWGGGLVAPNSTGSTAALTNNGTMLGYGGFGVIGTGAVFINNGYIGNESTAGTLSLRSRTSAGVESKNLGTIRASGNGGTIDIASGTIRQYAGFAAYSGHIEANGGAGTATVNIRTGAKIIGGHIDAYQGPGATVNVEGGAIIERDPAQDDFFGNGSFFVSLGTVNLNAGAILNSASFFVNFDGLVDFKPGATNFNNGSAQLESGLMKIGQGVLFENVTLTTGTAFPNAGGIVRLQNSDTSSQAELVNVTVNAGSSGQGVVQIGAPAAGATPAGFGHIKLQGTLTNNGFVDVVAGTAGTATASRIILDGNVTLAGTGRLTLEPSTQAALYGRIVGLSGAQTLTNAAGHTIDGAGAIGDFLVADRLQLANAGTIESYGGTLRVYLNGGAHTNSGTIRSKSTILLGNLADFTFSNTGSIESVGAGSTFSVGGNFGGPGPRATFTGNGTWLADAGLLEIRDDVTFNTTGALVARNGGTLQIGNATVGAASVDIGAASRLNIPAATALSATVKNNGIFAARPVSVSGVTLGTKLVLSGDISGAGAFTGNVQFNGMTNPGNAPTGRGTITSDVLTLGNTQTFTADLAGAADLDRLVVLGEASINGALRPTLATGYVPAYGTTFRVLSAASATGIFRTVANVVVDATHSLAVTYDATGASVVSAIPGDASLDGHVNFTDLLTTAQQYNTPSGQIWARADFNGDGATNFADLLVLAQHYGANALSDGNAAAIATSDGAFAADWVLAQSFVPEPGTAGLVAALGLALGRSRR